MALPKSRAGDAMRATGAALLGDVHGAGSAVFGKASPEAWQEMTQSPAGYAVRIDRFVEEGGAIEVYGSVRTAGGAFAGEFGATFSRQGGKLVAKTDNLLMESAHQGRGIGAAVARNLDAAYSKLGVKEVSLHASQVGRYTWAKAGYEWSPSTGREMASSFGGWLSKNGHDPSGASVALKGARALAESKHGKAFLLSDDAPNWYGSKRLN